MNEYSYKAQIKILFCAIKQNRFLNLIEYLTLGVILGLSAGISPGPLTALLVSETLNKNAWAGIKVALAPVVTDIPIVSACFFFLYRLKDFSNVLGILSLAGAVLIIIFGIKELVSKPDEIKAVSSSNSLSKGVLVNFLSPSPYIFWLTIGGPIVQKAYSISAPSAVAFIIPFYVLMISSKSIIALLTQKSKMFLKGKSYAFVVKALGIVLILLGAILFFRGLKELAIV